MAKIVITGSAVGIASSLKMEELKLIQKYRPKALTLMGGEDGKEPIFAIGPSAKGSVNAYGINFAEETNDDDKLACVTIMTDGVTGDVKEWVADKFGGAVINLNKLEATLPTVLEEIAAEKAQVMESVTVLM